MHSGRAGKKTLLTVTIILWVFQHFDYSRSLDSVTNLAVRFCMLSSSSWLHLGVPNLTALLQDWAHKSFISTPSPTPPSLWTEICHKTDREYIAERHFSADDTFIYLFIYSLILRGMQSDFLCSKILALSFSLKHEPYRFPWNTITRFPVNSRVCLYWAQNKFYRIYHKYLET